MSMTAWVTYVAGEGLPELGGEGPAHRLVDDVDDRDVAALAEGLGLAGEPQRTTEGSWRLGIGRASGRERGWPYVEISVGACVSKKNQRTMNATQANKNNNKT